MQTLARNGYTRDQMVGALHAAKRRVAFRYELLDSDDQHRRWLAQHVQRGEVTHNSLATIHRTCRITMREPSDIDWARDRIRPWMRLRMPDIARDTAHDTTQEPVDWPLGVFLPSTPTRAVDEHGRQLRDVEGYDKVQILEDHAIENSWHVAAGTNVIAAVKAVLDQAGITRRELTPTDETTSEEEWPVGTTLLRIANDLLDAANYTPVFFDGDGRAVCRPSRALSSKPTEYTYADDELSVVTQEGERTFDLFDVPNRWILIVSEPDREPLTATFTNDAPDSPTSTVARGRVIADVREDERATSQGALNSKAQRIAEKASQVYDIVDVDTALMPHHEHADVVRLEHAALGAADRYVEHKWSMRLEAGGQMSHRLRRVVSLS